MDSILSYGSFSTKYIVESSSSTKAPLKKAVQLVVQLLTDAKNTQSLFMDTYFRPEDAGDASSRNAARKLVIEKQTYAVNAVNRLRTRIIEKISVSKENFNNNKSSLIGLIKNIFIWMKLQGYQILLSKIDPYKEALENQTIPKFQYGTKVDCLQLLENLGFGDLSEKEALAEMMSLRGLEVENEGKLSSKEEILTFNQIAQTYLAQKDGFSQAAMINDWKIDSTSILSKDQFEAILTTISQMRRITTIKTAHELLTMHQFERYLSPEQLDQIASDLTMNPIWLISDAHENSTAINNAAFVTYINSYTQRYWTGEYKLPLQFHARDLDQAGKYLAEFLTISGINSYTGKELDEIRCFKLLQNTGLLAPLQSANELASFLIEKKLTLSNYAHLSTPEEKIRFNALVLEFLQQLATKTRSQLEGAKAIFELSHSGIESEKKIIYLNIEISVIDQIMQKLQKKYSGKSERFRFDLIDDAYKVFMGMQSHPTASPVTTAVTQVATSFFSRLTSSATQLFDSAKATFTTTTSTDQPLSDRVEAGIY